MKSKFKFLAIILLVGMSVSCQNSQSNKKQVASNDSAKKESHVVNASDNEDGTINDTLSNASTSANSIQEEKNTQQKTVVTMSSNWNKTEEEWKKILTPEQFSILREKGTERPYTGKYNMHFEKGKYVCAACGYELFSSSSKFESHCGWPAFDEEIESGRIKTKTDMSFGMKRVEIMCGQCGGHLGHVFDDGPTKTGVRYCVNSVSIDFKKEEKK